MIGPDVEPPRHLLNYKRSRVLICFGMLYRKTPKRLLKGPPTIPERFPKGAQQFHEEVTPNPEAAKQKTICRHEQPSAYVVKSM